MRRKREFFTTVVFALILRESRPGKYLSIDCEMVGIGIDGSESSLARVTVVNFYGAVQMDEFVRQKERVVDYRTRYSGIRPSDMIKGAFVVCVVVFSWLMHDDQQNHSRRCKNRYRTCCRTGYWWDMRYIMI